MADLTLFLRWLIEYAVAYGFWHFIAVYMIVRAITGIAAFVRFRRTNFSRKKGD